MELFKYIVKFIYRIRWWMVIFPCIAGIIAWFLTRNLEKTYDVKTTIFTGIISGKGRSRNNDTGTGRKQEAK